MEILLSMAFHRGHLNESRDKHIPLETAIDNNVKLSNFRSVLIDYQRQINSLGGTTLFIRDTPLMASVSTSPSCRLQIELFGKSICEVSILQDLHTRVRQDLLYNEILQLYTNNCSWDPLPEIYNGSEHLDVINSEKNYIMWDWNHITKSTSQQLATNFRPELLACINIAQSNQVIGEF